jgi:hypothetical protein
MTEFETECSLTKTDTFPHRITTSTKTAYISTEGKTSYNQIASKLFEEKAPFSIEEHPPKNDSPEVLEVKYQTAVKDAEERSRLMKAELNPTYKEFYRKLFSLSL